MDSLAMHCRDRAMKKMHLDLEYPEGQTTSNRVLSLQYEADPFQNNTLEQTSISHAKMRAPCAIRAHHPHLLIKGLGIVARPNPMDSCPTQQLVVHEPGVC